VKLTTAHGPLGLPAEYGLSWLLPRLIGATAAADLLLSSRVVTSDEAAAMGLFNVVVPAAELLPTVAAYVRDMIDRVAPSSLAATKRQLWLDFHRSVAAAVDDADSRMEEMMRGPEYAEGVAAFREKRQPRW
jgi:enoyl-CoA hydratase/carnithine racemase